ncbi:MAG TPA: hypothetical protein DCQ41_05915 [Cryomorphaceae bacterium]|nr:hypothetical protein [Cryomorphaceae bacterium]|tara:strand:+ start:1149 stop:1664 length:516 start_codon:yes stop_codon:yes gene_type:complete
MFSKIIRLGLTAAIFAWSIYQFADGEIGNGIALLFPMGLVLFTYFRNERILLTLWHMRKNDVAKAEKALAGIRNPEKSLIKGQLAYYYLLMGMIESQRKVGKAETLLKRALNTGLRLDQDKALAKLNLAGIALTKRRKKEAQILLTEVKKLDKNGALAEQTKYIKQQMKRI